MPPIVTYIDSGVLIFAAKGKTEAAALALPFLVDPAREYVTSDYVRLEIFPKANFHKNAAEIAFYNVFFTTTTRSIPTSPALLQYALEEGNKTGISGMDAVHVACAVFAGAEELITSEKTNHPMHRTTRVKVISILPPEYGKKKHWWKFWKWKLRKRVVGRK